MTTFNWFDMKREVTFGNPRVIESLHATEPAEDWSKVRSPARARRRLKRGFPQNIRHYRKPACFFIKAENAYCIHPELMKALREHTSESISRNIDRQLAGALFGIPEEPKPFKPDWTNWNTRMFNMPRSLGYFFSSEGS